MKYKIPLLAAVLAALLMGLPSAVIMEYAARNSEPVRTKLMENGVKADLDAFMKQHCLSNDDIRLIVLPKKLPFLNSWLSYSVSVGLTIIIFWALQNLLDWLIRKRKYSNHTSQPIAGKPGSG